MNLSNPLASIASVSTARVVAVLAKTTRPLSGREIASLAGDPSASSAWKVLNRLEAQGIVQAERHPTATYYRANRDHLAWPALEQLVRLRDELVGRLRVEIERWGVKPLHASIFGSVSRKDAGADSDLDLLLVHESFDSSGIDEDAWDDQLASLRDAVTKWTGNHCQTLALDPDRLRAHVEASDPIVDAWIRDELLLSGTPIRKLIGSLQ